MKKSIFSVVSFTVIMAGALASCVRAADTHEVPSPHAPAPVAATQPPLSAERTVAITITARVEAIDQAKREVTLKGPLGNVVSFVVDSRVERLAEISVGDDVTADYFVSLAGEVRSPTDEEKQHPFVVLTDHAQAPAGTSPARGSLQIFRVVAVVVGLDLPSQTFTLQGPMGNYGVIRAEKAENIKKLHLDDTVVVTYTEALAVSLRKATASAK